MPSGAKNWCFTLNNWTHDERDLLDALGSEGNGIRYLTYGEEVGAEGTPHLQGYVSFSARRTLSYVRRLLSLRAHYEVARGSPESNRDYCQKDGSFKEFGSLPGGQGQRNDLLNAVSAIKPGKRRREVLEEFPLAFARGYKMLHDLLELNAKRRCWVPEVHVYFGKPGTGKSRKAFEECPGS